MFLIDILKLLLNIAYLPFKLFRVKNKITLISRQSNNTTLEFQMIIDSLKDADIKMVPICKKLEKNMKSLIINFFLFFKEMYHIATSKILIVDGYCIVCSTLKHKKSLIVIQTWHANGIIKKIGLQTLDSRNSKQRKLAIKMNMHKNYDYVLSSSRETTKVYLKAFDITEKCILEYGTPMLDYLYNGNYKIDLKKYKKNNKKLNVIYMPTLRKNVELDMSELLEHFNFNKYNLYLKLHPAYKMDKVDPRITLITGCIGEEAFSLADYVITDYSNIMFESILVGIKTLIYIPDIEYYKKDPGLNIDIEKEAKKYTSTKIENILKMLEEPYDMKYMNKFAHKYIETYDGNCMERIKEFIIEKVR